MQVSLKDLKQAVITIAEENAEFSYAEDTVREGPTCRYERNGQASCIIGHALKRLGVPISTLQEMDNVGDIVTVIEDSSFNTLFHDPLEEGNGWFETVQQYQDEGHRWEQCIDRANERYALADA